MDRWISQLYVLMALALISVVAVFSLWSPSETQRFKITLGDLNRPVIERRTIPFDRIEPVLENFRAASSKTANGKRERILTEQEILELIKRLQSREHPAILEGVPLGAPNVLQQLAELQGMSSLGT